MLQFVMSESKTFEFSNKSERNDFLSRNRLCIAGSLSSWPNVLNHQGEFVGDAYQLEEGGQQIVVWSDFLGLLAEEDLERGISAEQGEQILPGEPRRSAGAP